MAVREARREEVPFVCILMSCPASCPHCFEDVAMDIYSLAQVSISHRTPHPFPLHLRVHWIQRKPSLVHQVLGLVWSWRECRRNAIIPVVPLFWFFFPCHYLLQVASQQLLQQIFEFCAALASCRKKNMGWFLISHCLCSLALCYLAIYTACSSEVLNEVLWMLRGEPHLCVLGVLQHPRCAGATGCSSAPSCFHSQTHLHLWIPSGWFFSPGRFQLSASIVILKSEQNQSVRSFLPVLAGFSISHGVTVWSPPANITVKL